MNQTEVKVAELKPAPVVSAMNALSALPQYPVAQIKKSGDLINREQFTPEEITMAKAIAAGVNFNDTNTIHQFGAAPQQQMSAFLDTLIADITVSEAGVAGDLTLMLSESYDLLRINDFKRELSGATKGITGAIGKTFGFVKDLAWLIKNLRDQKTSIGKKFAKMQEMAEARQEKLIGFNVKLDTMDQNSDDYIRVVAVCIMGGEMALLRGVEEYQSRKIAAALPTADDREPARLNALARQIAAFETRLLKLQIAYTEALAVTKPRIQAIRQTGEIEIQNILDAILFDLTRLKALVVQVAALTNIKEAQEEDAKRRKISAKIGDAAADMFGEAYTAALETQGRGLDEVRALAGTAEKMLDTLKKGKQIDEENRKKRETARGELVTLKENVQTALKAIELS